MISPVVLGDLGAELGVFRSGGGEGALFAGRGSDRSRSSASVIPFSRLRETVARL
jgi:hypothetical protein